MLACAAAGSAALPAASVRVEIGPDARNKKQSDGHGGHYNDFRRHQSPPFGRIALSDYRDGMPSKCIDSGQLQDPLHVVPRVEHPGFGGANRYPDDLGDLIGRFLMIVDEIEHLAMAR